MIWLKFLHVTAIAVWSAGLISLPGLYLRRAHVRDEDALHRLQALVRFLYVRIVSPAAFIAVGSGTALIFLRGTFEPWFSVKLLLVGVLVFGHILTGLVIIRLFEEGNVYPVWRFLTVTVVSVVVVFAILFVVLGKPAFPDVVPAAMREPGALSDIVRDLNPFQR
jgi:putative membrane protein